MSWAYNTNTLVLEIPQAFQSSPCFLSGTDRPLPGSETVTTAQVGTRFLAFNYPPGTALHTTLNLGCKTFPKVRRLFKKSRHEKSIQSVRRLMSSDSASTW